MNSGWNKYGIRNKELEMRNTYLKFIAALFLFGSNGIIAGMISMNSYEIVFFRTMIGALALTALFIAVRKKSLRSGKADSSVMIPSEKKKLALVIGSGVCMGVSWMFLYEAFASIGVGISTVIYYTAPIALIMLSPFIFGEKLTGKKIACFSAVVLGMLLINIESVAGSFNFHGTFCAAMSAVSFVVMLVLNKKSAVSGIVNSVFQLGSAFASAAVCCFALYGGVSLPATLSDAAWLIVLGVVNTGIGCFLYFSNFMQIPVQTVSILGYIEPVSAIVLASVILSEDMTALQTAGIAVVMIASILAEVRLPATQSPALAHRSRI